MKLPKIALPFVVVFLFLWQVSLIFQGLDLADTGFHLSAYRFVFDDPYSVQYYMMYWLSEVGGHFWMTLFPSGGLLWARFGWVFFISFAVFVYYLFLKDLLGKERSVWGLGITLMFALLGGPECLNYDIFTVFGYSLGLLFLFRGLKASRGWLLFASGIVFGASIFFKLSNLTVLAFLLIPLFWSYLKRWSFSRTIKNAMLWLAGLAVGAGLVLICIKLAGHWELFFDNLKFVSSMGADAQSSHGLKPMLLSYLNGYFNASVMAVIFVVGIVAFFRLYGERKVTLATSAIVVIISVGVLTGFMGDVFWSKIRYIFLGLMIINGAFLLVSRRYSDEIRLAALLGLLLVVLAPLGSDTGLEKSLWGMWILGPMLLMSKDESTFVKFSVLTGTQMITVLTLLGAAVFSTSVVHAWQTTYFDSGSRWHKVQAIHHPDLKFIYTSPKRAKVVDELIQEGFPKIVSEQYLLGFIEIPMVNYLSGKRPFLSTSWPKLYYNPEKFKQKLEEALAKRKEFPAIIRQKQNTMLNEWPGNFDPEYLNYPEGLSKWPEHGRILNEFIDRNGYQVVWENEMFQLFVRE